MKTRTRNSVLGVTLIELMVVVAIIGILSAIVTPLYASYMREGRRGDMILKLLEFSQTAERSFALSGIYTKDNLTDILPGNSDSYDLTLTVDSDFEYSVTATAVGGQVEDEDCLVLSYNYLGESWASDQSSGGSDNTSICWP